MTTILDEISPSYIGSEYLTLQRVDPLSVLQAFRNVALSVDYSGAEAYGGIVLPLEQVVTGPSPLSFVRRIFDRDVPDEINFTPQEGGRFTVMLREIGHNKLYAVLSLDIEGSINDPTVTQNRST